MILLRLWVPLLVRYVLCLWRPAVRGWRATGDRVFLHPEDSPDFTWWWLLYSSIICGGILTIYHTSSLILKGLLSHLPIFNMWKSTVRSTFKIYSGSCPIHLFPLPPPCFRHSIPFNEVIAWFPPGFPTVSHPQSVPNQAVSD